MNVINPVMFMPRVTPHVGGDGCNVADLPAVLLTFVIVGIILYILGILANILHVKFSRGFDGTPISWADIKPDIDNTLLGCFCGVFGVVFIGAAAIVGLCAGVYWVIVTL
jgi:hypothetical protein